MKTREDNGRCYECFLTALSSCSSGIAWPLLFTVVDCSVLHVCEAKGPRLHSSLLVGATAHVNKYPMTFKTGRIFSRLSLPSTSEVFEPLVEAADLRLERIISTGQHTPADVWLVQDWDEWVLLLTGAAKLLIEGEAAPRDLQPGDWIVIPAGVRHRVEWTCADPPTLWLALHYNLR